MINMVLIILIAVIFVFAFAKTIRGWRDGDCCGCSGDKCPDCVKKLDSPEGETVDASKKKD